MTILITGAAGFIGFHVTKALLDHGKNIVGLDNLNDYYDVSLKQARLDQLLPYKEFKFHKCNLTDQDKINNIFEQEHISHVIHLAAQAGVRYSIENPYAYISSNIEGFINILEGCRHYGVKHLVYASSSSVYGANTKMPFSVHDNVDHPISLYGATKKSNELMAHCYSHLYRLPVTGLRFFTVYGPWGRPDMSYFIFTKNIIEDKVIDIFNEGNHKRDFTYIDDIVNGVIKVLDRIPETNSRWSGDIPDPGTSNAPYKLYNIGNNNPVELIKFIELLENCIGKKSNRNYLPIQPGDVPATYADVDDLKRDIGFNPGTSVETGIKSFVEWYKDYFQVK